MSRPLNEARLEAENRHFEGTGGVSAEAACLHLLPAFRDERTGRVEIARFRNGAPAPFHLIEALPDDWAMAHDDSGAVTVLRKEIVCGFVRGEQFYTRAEAAAL